MAEFCGTDVLADGEKEHSMPKGRALWASTGARGGITTFVSTMRNTLFWREWNVRVVTTHTNASTVSRVLLFATGLMTFVYELVFHRPDIVHLHAAAYGSFVRKGLLAGVSKVLRVPVVIHMHGADFVTYFSNASRTSQFLIRATLERADAVVALGHAWAHQIRALAPMANIIVVPNAVTPRDPVSQATNGSIAVLFLGEIGDRKGTFTLLKAWAQIIRIANQNVDAQLTVVGDGEVERAQRFVRQHGLESTVDIRGWISHAEAQDLLSASHVLVLPSLDEGQPMAILEAMARGLCIVASSVGGIPEMLGDDCGLLISPDCVDELATALAHVITDHKVRSKLGVSAYNRLLAEFNLEVVSQQFDEMYCRLTSSGKP